MVKSAHHQDHLRVVLHLLILHIYFKSFRIFMSYKVVVLKREYYKNAWYFYHTKIIMTGAHDCDL